MRCRVDADAACDHAVKDAGELGDNLWNGYEFFVQVTSRFQITIVNHDPATMETGDGNCTGLG